MENNDHYYQLPGDSKPKRTMKIVALCALALFAIATILVFALNGDNSKFPVVDAELSKAPLLTANVGQVLNNAPSYSKNSTEYFVNSVKLWKKLPKLSVEFKLEESPDELASSTVVFDTVLKDS